MEGDDQNISLLSELKQTNPAKFKRLELCLNIAVDEFLSRNLAGGGGVRALGSQREIGDGFEQRSRSVLSKD